MRSSAVSIRASTQPASAVDSVSNPTWACRVDLGVQGRPAMWVKQIEPEVGAVAGGEVARVDFGSR